MAKVLTTKQLEHFKKKLIAEKNKVINDMGDIKKDSHQSISDESGENSHYSYHLGDSALLDYGREFTMGLAERHDKYLEQIDEALERIDNGTYGICLITGKRINKERLEEVPVAKYSVEGKEIYEKRKHKGLS